MFDTLDQECIDMLRFLSVDMVQKANSGHPGLPLGAAPMAYVLWSRFLKHDPAHPTWPDRDRFVLSAGHGSALLYSLLYACGYDLSLDDLKQFRQSGSKAPGHPERGHTAGVEITTGPLGQGMANAVGMAIAEAQLAARYNGSAEPVVDHHTWAIVSDGDLMEGVTSEAASLAGHLQLGKLICLYDDNSVTLSAGTDMTFSEDRARRFQAYGWQTIEVDDGNDLNAIAAALTAARADPTRPSLILVRTHLGFGSPEQDSFKAHGSPLGAADVEKTKKSSAGRSSRHSSFPKLRSPVFEQHLVGAPRHKPIGMIVSPCTPAPVPNSRVSCSSACAVSCRTGGTQRYRSLRPTPRGWQPVSPAARR